MSEQIEKNEVLSSEVNNSNRVERKLVAFLLCFFLGAFGAHNFYKGQYLKGILHIVLLILSPITLFISAFVLGFWILVELVLILIRG